MILSYSAPIPHACLLFTPHPSNIWSAGASLFPSTGTPLPPKSHFCVTVTVKLHCEQGLYYWHRTLTQEQIFSNYPVLSILYTH